MAHPNRIRGGEFELSLDGLIYEFIHRVDSSMELGWNELVVSVSCRYIRYISPADGYGNIAEIEFYGTP